MPIDITPAQVPDFLNAVTADLNTTDVQFTQNLTMYTLTDAFLSAAPKSATGADGFRYDVNVGTNERLRGTSPYAIDTARVRPSTERKFVAPWVMKTDEIEYSISLAARVSDETEIYDKLLEKNKDLDQRAIDTWEDELMGVPDSDTDLKKLRGIPYYIRQLRAGQTDAVGSFAGTHVTFGDGTEVATDNGQSRTAVTNNRLRNWAATRGAAVDGALVRLARFAMINTNFRRAKNQRGQAQSPSSIMLCVGSEDYADLEAYINAGPDDRGGNARPFTENLRLGVATIELTPTLDRFANKPIYGIRSDRFDSRSVPGFWRAMSKWEKAANISDMVVQKCDWQATFFARASRDAGFVLHLPN